MDKICNIAILLASLIAIVAAFVTIPSVTAILLILGGIGGLNSADRPEFRVRIYGAAVVLLLGGPMLMQIPVIGEHLAAIFAGIAAMLVGISVVAISLAIVTQARKNLLA